MGKRNKKKYHHHALMKEWPDDSDLVSYSSLIEPIKKIYHEGYKVERKPIRTFIYKGYNIGKEDRFYFPTPEERFTARWLENEDKFDRTLMDNIFAVIFQLGMEQGRRTSRHDRYANDLLQDIIDARTKTIRCLRQRLSQYEPEFADEKEIPLDRKNEEEDLIINDVFENEATEMVDNVETPNTKED